MEAVMEEHHTHVAIQMRETSPSEIGKIIGRLMVIHVHAGRKILSQDLYANGIFQIKFRSAFTKQSSRWIFRAE